MKVLFISTVNLQDRSNSGVIKKVQGQVKGLRELVSQVDSALLRNHDFAVIEKQGNTEDIALPFGTIRKKVCFILEYFLKCGIKYDLLYLRIPGMSFNLIRILKEFHSKGTKVVIEVYSYPLVIERIKSAKRRINENVVAALKDFISAIIDGCIYRFLKTCTDYIVTYSLDKKIWGIPTINICNGIDFDNEKLLQVSKKNNKSIHLITVANISYWHGYDRLIRGMSNYYKNGTKEYNIIFHIVGNGPEKMRLEALTKELNLKDNVVFYGVKVGKELDNIYADKDLGVASLAMHRKDCTYTSELKIREYFAKGLPFIIGTKDVSMDLDQVNRFCLAFPPDESAIDIDKIIDFWLSVKRDDSIRKEMREYGMAHYDWKIQMQKVLTQVKG